MANESNDLSRRDFAKAAVAAAVAPTLAACATAAPESAPAPEASPAATAPTPAAAPAAGGRQEPTPLARALAEAIRVQYGDRVTDEEMAKVQRGISGMLSTAERLRRFPLPISTEPTFTYRVPGGER